MTSPLRAPLPVDRTALEDYRDQLQRRGARPEPDIMAQMQAARERAEAMRAMTARDATAGPSGPGPAAGSFASIRQVMEPAANFLPGIGDALAAKDAAGNAREGRWGAAAVDVASMIPVVGALGDGARAMRKNPIGKKLAEMDFEELITLAKRNDPDGLYDASALAREGQPMWSRKELVESLGQSFGPDDYPWQILQGSQKYR
jgi:hypothetical protein